MTNEMTVAAASTFGDGHRFVRVSWRGGNLVLVEGLNLWTTGGVEEGMIFLTQQLRTSFGRTLDEPNFKRKNAEGP